MFCIRQTPVNHLQEALIPSVSSLLPERQRSPSASKLKLDKVLGHRCCPDGMYFPIVIHIGCRQFLH